MKLRDFQRSACHRVKAEFDSGKKAVLIVAPTAAGKTVMGAAYVNKVRKDGARVLWVAHRKELIDQSASVLSSLCREKCGIIMAQEQRDLSAGIQVASIQTLLSCGFPTEIEYVFLDEAHHYPADEWGMIRRSYGDTRFVGLTATPMRADGRPLGDLFDSLVVAAHYDELLNMGFLVPADVYQPEHGYESNAVAQDPLKAYADIAPGSLAFAFASRVSTCEEHAGRFTAAGYPSAVVSAETPKRERETLLSRFRAKELLVLWNVGTLTEGVDVPEASTCILAGGVEHIARYLQMVGRVLRTAPGKTKATVIDLVGATLKHGLPGERMEYSLDGEGIRRTSPEKLRVCTRCGITAPSWHTKCPSCGFVPPVALGPTLRIYSDALRAVYAGTETPRSAKEDERSRIVNTIRSNGLSWYFLQKRMKELFGERVLATEASDGERRKEFSRIMRTSKSVGQAKCRFKNIFGEWPNY